MSHRIEIITQDPRPSVKLNIFLVQVVKYFLSKNIERYCDSYLRGDGHVVKATKYVTMCNLSVDTARDTAPADLFAPSFKIIGLVLNSNKSQSHQNL